MLLLLSGQQLHNWAAAADEPQSCIFVRPTKTPRHKHVQHEARYAQAAEDVKTMSLTAGTEIPSHADHTSQNSKDNNTTTERLNSTLPGLDSYLGHSYKLLLDSSTCWAAAPECCAGPSAVLLFLLPAVDQVLIYVNHNHSSTGCEDATADC
jgi:hypothetical protein